MSSMLPSNVPQFEREKPPPKNGGPPVGAVITLVLALALIAVIAVAVTRLSSGPLAPPTATKPTQVATSAQQPAPTIQPGRPADAATQQAIEQVIQQVDQAQIQAIENNDPNVMAATATPGFYQEQVTTNQDLMDNGVTDIKLVNLEWGDITVNGSTATATDWETWSTTFDDGTTQQSRDRNVYTLVLDNGTWKVSADDHPDQQNASPVAPGAP
jgi:hypothetical protein